MTFSVLAIITSARKGEEELDAEERSDADAPVLAFVAPWLGLRGGEGGMRSSRWLVCDILTHVVYLRICLTVD